MKDFGDVHLPEFFPVQKRKLECRAFDMADQNGKIVRVDQRMFWIFGEKIVGIVHDELIDRRACSNQHGRRFAGFSSCPPGSLPGACNTPWITGKHGHIQASDIDS